LGSLLRQTSPADELIIVDDGSSDESAAVISSYVEAAPNARFVRNERNMGYVTSVNRVIGSAKGDILFFAGADDIFYPGLFEKARALLGAYPNAALFSARSDLVDADGGNRRLFDTPMPIQAPGYIDPAQAADYLLREDSWFMGNVSLYRRGPLLAAGGLTTELGSFADGYMARCLALRHGACFTPEVLGAWRRLDLGMAMSHLSNADQVAAMIEKVQRKMDGAGSPFPPGYAKRWGGRHLFGTYRAQAAQRRRSLTGMRRGWAAVCDGFRNVALFIYYRPFDLMPVVKRQFAAVMRKSL
jgi:glycosyltransferase involved in cell wall biosynthesis